MVVIVDDGDGGVQVPDSTQTGPCAAIRAADPATDAPASGFSRGKYGDKRFRSSRWVRDKKTFENYLNRRRQITVAFWTM